ncbi:hypothetical protein, partial [Streptomyces sp. NRRL S-15]|uniref:hypothetical protein n=1 Tax=Streptomyces sp. NRRL S-15 TaxID=1463886 RepID=UPI001F2D876B
VEAAGGATAHYGLPERIPLSGGSPVSDAFRTGRPLWLTTGALAFSHEGGAATVRASGPLGVMPLGARERP